MAVRYSVDRGKAAAVAVIAVLLFAGVAMPSSGEEAVATNTSDVANQTYVVYHPGTPSGLESDYNDTEAPSDRSVLYYGNVISTEYNPQVWEDVAKWYGIKEYVKDKTVVFTGWKYLLYNNGSPEYSEMVFDPGDVMDYENGNWYGCWSDNYKWRSGTYGKLLYTTKTADVNGEAADNGTDVQYIHVMATWGLIEKVDTNSSNNKFSKYTDGSPYTQFHLVSGNLSVNSNMLMNATIRAASDSVTITVGSVSLSGDTILDSGKYVFSITNGGNHMDNDGGLYAQGHRLIIGEGIDVVVTVDNDKDIGYRLGNIAGGGWNANTVLESTKVIVHDGLYSNVVAGSTKGTVTNDCVLIVKGGQITDTLMGAGHYGKCGGNTYIYATGLRMYGDYYEEDMLDNGLLDESFDEIQDSMGKVFKPTESSIFTGGGSGDSTSNTCSYTQNVYVYLSGKSSVWDLQAAGRRGGHLREHLQRRPRGGG